MKTPLFRLLSWFGFCSVIPCCPVAGQTLFAPNASLGAVSNGEDYIGINTATPAARLSVNGYTPPVGEVWGAGDTILFHNGSIGDNGSFGQWWRWNVYREAGTNNYRYLDFSDRPNAAEIMMDGNIYFRTGTHTGTAGDIITISNRMVITADGNIGIGTITPGTRLEVRRDVSAALGPIIAINNYSGGAGAGSAIDFNGTNTSNVDPQVRLQSVDDGHYSAHLIFLTKQPGAGANALSERLRIASNGNVGIGTTSPTEKLSVNGTIRAKEVLVEASPWPDDVFTPGYNLPSVEEVASHIDTEGHLPGVPSAAAVAENGVAIGQMQQVLLRKVEELTLYVIQQQRINAAQAERIRELEQRLNARPEQQPRGE